MSLVIVGSVAFDAIETPYGKTDRIIGGAGSYIALAASYFGEKPKLISVVGDDFPKAYLDLLNSKSVDTEGIEVCKGEKSFFWSGRYHSNMNQRDTLVTELNVLAKFDPKVPDSYQNPDYLMLGNLSPEVQLKVLNRLNKRPKFVALDTMNFWIEGSPDNLKKVIAQTDALIINDEEAQMLSGELSVVEAAEAIQKMGPKYIIVKKGEHGALLFGEGKIFSAPALPLAEVFDPTGAGDSFAGGFIGYIAKNDDYSFNTLKTAVIVGSVMASFDVEKFGTERLTELSRDDINTRLNRFSDLVHFDKFNL
jgi:sugar/nucleoside kinase (ribokinase family)